MSYKITCRGEGGIQAWVMVLEVLLSLALYCPETQILNLELFGFVFHVVLVSLNKLVSFPQLKLQGYL